MKDHNTRNAVLGPIGLLALLAYILACTSFSPDDKKVLYPSFDGRSGDLAVSVYNRSTRTTELVFVPRFYEGSDPSQAEPRLLRPQWLPGGKSILIAWPGGSHNENDGLNLAVIPSAGKRPARLFFLPGLAAGSERLVAALPVAGSHLFLSGESNMVLRLDLETGVIMRHAGQAGMSLYADPAGRRVFYLREISGETNRCELGRMDPDTFAATPLSRFTAGRIDETGLVSFSPDGSRMVVSQQTNGITALLLLEGYSGRVIAGPAAQGEQLAFGNAVFSPKGDKLYASFYRTAEGEANAGVGFLEVTLANGQVRRTTLFVTPHKNEDGVALYFQIGLSHDGKTLAGASTYFAVEREKSGLKSDDCALFLVDLTHPQRRVQRVPIPLPREPRASRD